MFKVSHKSEISYYYTSTLMTHRLEKANFVLDWYRGYYVRFTSHLSLRIRRTDSRKVRGSIPRLSTVFFCNSAFDEYCFYLYVYFRLVCIFDLYFLKRAFFSLVYCCSFASFFATYLAYSSSVGSGHPFSCK